MHQRKDTLKPTSWTETWEGKKAQDPSFFTGKKEKGVGVPSVNKDRKNGEGSGRRASRVGYRLKKKRGGFLY